MAAPAGDKVLFGFVLATLWWQLGGSYTESNAFNIAGILNFWVTMPAFGCASCHLVGLTVPSSTADPAERLAPHPGTFGICASQHRYHLWRLDDSTSCRFHTRPMRTAGSRCILNLPQNS